MISGWVNDETTLRTYGATADAGKALKGMLDDDQSPDDWAALQETVSEAKAVERLDSASSTKP